MNTISICSNRIIQPYGKYAARWCSETRRRCAWWKAAPCIILDALRFIGSAIRNAFFYMEE